MTAVPTERTPSRAERTQANPGRTQSSSERLVSHPMSTPKRAILATKMSQSQINNKKDFSHINLQEQRERESHSMQKYLDLQSEKGNIEVETLKVDFEIKKLDLEIKKLDFNLKLLQYHTMIKDTEDKFGQLPNGLLEI